jgi:hypothetical protein
MNGQEIRTRLEQRREHDREQFRRHEATIDASAVQVMDALAHGLRLVDETPTPGVEGAPAEPTSEQAAARAAIDARRLEPPSSTPAPRPGEPLLRAALRGVVEDYAAPLTPSDRTVAELEALSGFALDEADSYGMWADLQLKATLAVRAAMRDVVDIVTDRAESIIIAELLAAGARLAREYPDAPRPDTPYANDPES